MFRIITSLFLALTPGLGISAQAEVEFIDYDYARFSQDVTECDRLASHGRAPGHVAPAVSSSGMDKPAAIAACQQAVAADPNNPRLNYQLGRAYGYSGRGEEAMPYRLKALEADYRAARYRRLAALVALPRQGLRGDFEACGPAISPGDLRAYLNEAKAQSNDYYVGMLVDDLLAEVEERYTTQVGVTDG